MRSRAQLICLSLSLASACMYRSGPSQSGHSGGGAHAPPTTAAAQGGAAAVGGEAHASGAGGVAHRDPDRPSTGGRAGDAAANGGTSGAQAGGATSGQGGAAGQAAATHWVGGYYVGYQKDLYPVTEIEWSGLTHVVVGRLKPKADGTLDATYDIDVTNGPALAAQLVDAAHAHGKKAIVMIGGSDVHDAWVAAASPNQRTAFAQNLAAVVRSVGYDGLDLDWEPISDEDEAPLLSLAQALRSLLPQAIIQVPVNWVGAGSRVSAFYGKLAAVVDQLNLMTYGMAGAWDGWQSWHSSALSGDGATTPSSIESSVSAFLAAGVPAAKLGIGIGFFGLCWVPPVTAPKQDLKGSDIAASDNGMSYATIMDTYYKDDERHWDASAQVPYLSMTDGAGPDRCSFISYDDEQSIRAKAEFVKQHGLGGAIVWTINQGYRKSATERNALLKAMSAFLQ